MTGVVLEKKGESNNDLFYFFVCHAMLTQHDGKTIQQKDDITCNVHIEFCNGIAALKLSECSLGAGFLLHCLFLCLCLCVCVCVFVCVKVKVKIFFNDGSLSKHFTCFFTSSHHNNKL